MKTIQQRKCIICEALFEPPTNHPKYVLCENPKCKHIRHKQTTNEMVRKKSLARDIKRSKDLLEEHGYVILPQMSNFRIIMEPIERSGI